MSIKIKLIFTFVAAFTVLGLLQTMGSSGRIDLTDNALYTLSDGTQQLIESLDRPVELKLYFSQEGTGEIVRIRNYAKRVNELLAEMSSLNASQLSFVSIDPEPFSEAEDEAAAFGLDAAPVAPGQTIYFGLVAVPQQEKIDDDTPLVEDQSAQVIAFLQPDREAFLEYDIAQLIHKVGNPKKPVLGLLSGLEVKGGFDMMSRQPQQPWTSIEQMESFYDVQTIEAQATTLPEGLDVLVLIQPKTPSDALLYAIDQFALSGGRILAFVDPLANADRPNPMAQQETIRGADWNRLFHAWGVELAPEQVVGDMQLALMVNQGQGQASVRHAAIQNYPKEQIGITPFTSQITQVNIATAGEWRAWDPQSQAHAETEHNKSTKPSDLQAEVKPVGENENESAGENEAEAEEAHVQLSPAEIEHFESINTKIVPLLFTTAQSGVIPAQAFAQGVAIAQVNSQLKTDGQIRNIAILLDGTAVSAFANGPPELPVDDGSPGDAPKSQPSVQAEHLATGTINTVLFADTDLLTDYLWVQRVGQFRGQSIAQPFADNGDLLLNTLEYLSGSQSLMSIRSRGTYSRPFSKVNELRLSAEQRFTEQELQLNQQLEATEAKLAQLQPEQDDTLTLSQEQQAALIDFQKERLRIRKSLRNVHLQLNQDIRALGLKIKAINIFLVPVLLFIFAVFFFTIRQRKMEQSKVSFRQTAS